MKGRIDNILQKVKSHHKKRDALKENYQDSD
jgi:hypothetical protein